MKEHITDEEARKYGALEHEDVFLPDEAEDLLTRFEENGEEVVDDGDAD